MADTSQVKEHMEVIGADGVHVGTVDSIEGDYIKLTRKDSGEGAHKGHHHYLSSGLIAGVEGDKVRLSPTGAVATTLFREESGGRLWNWNKLGLGALGVAAVGAAGVAGAALLKRRSSTDEEFQLRLETDENVRLISSKKVEGTPVVGRDGEKLGQIESFMVDKYTGRVAYAIMTFGGLMGVGASYFPLPWPLLDYDVEKDGFALDITKEQLAEAPKFEANNEPEFNPELRRRILVYYRP